MRWQVRHLSPRISKKPQGPSRRDGRVKLAQAARRRITRIGKFGLACRNLAFIERGKIIGTHVYLAAHFRDFRRALLQRVWNARHGFEIVCNIFTHAPVAARRAAHQHAIFIAQRRGQAVDFRLRGQVKALGLIQCEKFSNALDEVVNVRGVKRIAERQHRHAMRDLGKALRRLGTNPFRRAVVAF